jgi:hypothetical protein
MKVLQAAIVYFGLVFTSGFVLGTVRTLALVPKLGARTSELVELPLMLTVIWQSAKLVNQRFLRGSSPAARLSTGLAALSLLLAAEMGVGVRLRGLSPREALINRDRVSGTAYYAGLCVMALAPRALKSS